MGFHVQLRDGDDRLLKAIRLNPSEVFGRPYAGYLFFLIGAADSAALEWLKANLVSLDSLTGDHIAFALFADRVPIQLDVPYNSSDDVRVSRFLGELPITDVRRIDSYIKTGNLGRVADGDHLYAMTYAVDRVARAFGVVDKLPCLLIIDAFSSEKNHVIELTENILAELIPILRSAIHRLTTEDQFANFIEALELLGGFQRRFRDLRSEEQDERNVLSKISTVQGIEEEIDNGYQAVKVSIRNGSYHELQLHCARLLKGNAPLPTLDEPTGQRLKGYARTIAALERFEPQIWPLSEAEMEECRRLFSDHVSRFLPESSIDSGDLNPEAIKYAIRALRACQITLTAEILKLLPDPEVLKTATLEQRNGQILAADQKLEELNAELRELREQALDAIDFCSSDAAPSLHRIISDIAHKKRFELGVATVKDAAIAYGAKILSPETLLKILHGGAGA